MNQTNRQQHHQAFLDFLQQLAEDRMTIECWNQMMVGPGQLGDWETYRKQLSRMALSIGQCSAVPFPESLRLQAAQMREHLLQQ